MDANIIIQILKANMDLLNFVSTLNKTIDTTVYAEVLQGQKSNIEKKRVKTLLNSIPLIHFTPDISKKTIELIDSYSNSHSLFLPDAQIAACCLVYNFKLLTYNLKDFQFINGLQVSTPPFPQI